MRQEKETRKGRLKQEIIGIALIGAALLVFASLNSWEPMDLAWDSGPPNAPRKFANLIGPIGAAVSELLMKAVGYASYAIPFFLLLLGLRYILSFQWRAGLLRSIGGILFILAFATLLHLSVGEEPYRPRARSPLPVPKTLTILPGGLLGKFISDSLTSKFNHFGTYFPVITILVLSAVMAIQFSLGRFFRWIAAAAAGVYNYARVLLTNRLEKRKREKLRRLVIQKRTKPKEAENRNGTPATEEEIPPEIPPRVVKSSERSADSEVRPLRKPREEPAPCPEEDEFQKAVEKKRERTQRRKARSEPVSGTVPIDFDVPSGEFVLPPISLLDPATNSAHVDNKELVENSKALVSKLKEFMVDGSVQQIIQGPIVTTYEFKPNAGVKYSKITGLGEDLCLALQAESVRIDRIPGKSTVGIEVPNHERELICLREVIESEKFQQSDSRLTLALGKQVDGEIFVTDLAQMPHFLIAGATGTGKSVAVNSMIVSILYKARPDQVKLILVDPKRIELSVYQDIPHLLTPVVTDPKVASNVLQWTTTEMENRYKRLAIYGVRNIDQFNMYIQDTDELERLDEDEKEELKPLPYIVVVIDELADLMMVAAKDVEESISRLAAMARAVGIHLILATQRPSVDVITGVIKANFPSRVSFRVASKVDSRTIIDCNGAECLLGRGDMLFLPPGTSRLVRVHGTYVSNAEVQRVCNFLRRQGKPEFDTLLLASGEGKKADMEGELDELYDDATRIVIESGQASISYLQRRLKLGYSRAARLIDMMEYNGIVGPKDGSRNREILVGPEYLENFKVKTGGGFR
jgi:S-DNA-T family DNA segregation ATPase FtsK/SpoIIIE